MVIVVLIPPDTTTRASALDPDCYYVIEYKNLSGTIHYYNMYECVNGFGGAETLISGSQGYNALNVNNMLNNQNDDEVTGIKFRGPGNNPMQLYDVFNFATGSFYLTGSVNMNNGSYSISTSGAVEIDDMTIISSSTIKIQPLLLIKQKI